MSLMVPIVIDRSGKNERAWDIYSRMLEERVIFLTGPINDALATSITAQLLFLQHTNSSKDISMYINSPGGSVTAGLAIYDTMRYVAPDIQTICIGAASSMAAVLLTAGTEGNRLALPNARIMIHQPKAGYEGQASDIEIHAAEVIRMKTKLESIIATHTGQDIEKVKVDTDRDCHMTSDEAVEYGLIDKIVESV